MSGLRIVLGAVCAVLLLTGCGLGGATGDGGDGGEEPAPFEPEQVRRAALDLARGAADALREAGLEVGRARGEFESCRTEPAPGVGYRVGLTLGDGDTLREQVEVATSALLAAGWELQSSQSGDGASASLTRGKASASVGAGRGGGAAVAVVGPCVDTDEDTDLPPLRQREEVDLG